MSQTKPTEREAAIYALNYILTGDRSEGYRAAFPNTRAKAKTIHEKASRFNKLGKVQASILRLREVVLDNLQKEHVYTIEKAFDELEEARVLSSTPDKNGKVNPSAMINATMAKVKLVGLLEPKKSTPMSQIEGGILVLPEGKSKEEQWTEYNQLPSNNQQV